MFGFFKKRENPHRAGLRDDFLRVTTRLRAADPAIQMAVGHSINMANSLFIQRFGSIAVFRGLPKPEKYKYIEALTNAEEKMTKEKPQAAVGFALFKMWIGALTEDDEDLLQEFSAGLAELSRKGDLPL